MRAEERREFQRVRVEPSISATLNDAEVSIVEIGILGARVAHASDTLPDGDGELRFSVPTGEIVIRCEIVRTGSGQSGLRFTAVVGDSGDDLRRFLNSLVLNELEARRFHGHESIRQPIDGDITVRGRDAGFLSYRLDDGVWSRRRILIPEQPRSGFTVARVEDSEEMQRLCRVYQASDPEGRRLIRMFAELSVSEALQLPARTDP